MSIVEVWQCDSCGVLVRVDAPDVARWLSVAVRSDSRELAVSVHQYCGRQECRDKLLERHLGQMIEIRKLPRVPPKPGKPAKVA